MHYFINRTYVRGEKYNHPQFTTKEVDFYRSQNSCSVIQKTKQKHNILPWPVFLSDWSVGSFYSFFVSWLCFMYTIKFKEKYGSVFLIFATLLFMHYPTYHLKRTQ